MEPTRPMAWPHEFALTRQTGHMLLRRNAFPCSSDFVAAATAVAARFFCRIARNLMPAWRMRIIELDHRVPDIPCISPRALLRLFFPNSESDSNICVASCVSKWDVSHAQAQARRR